MPTAAVDDTEEEDDKAATVARGAARESLVVNMARASGGRSLRCCDGGGVPKGEVGGGVSRSVDRRTVTQRRALAAGVSRLAGLPIPPSCSRIVIGPATTTPRLVMCYGYGCDGHWMMRSMRMALKKEEWKGMRK